MAIHEKGFKISKFEADSDWNQYPTTLFNVDYSVLVSRKEMIHHSSIWLYFFENRFEFLDV